MNAPAIIADSPMKAFFLRKTLFFRAMTSAPGFTREV